MHQPIASQLLYIADLQIEINTGLFNVEKQKFRDDNCLLFRKKITNIEECLERKRASKFIDLYPATNEVTVTYYSIIINVSLEVCFISAPSKGKHFIKSLFSPLFVRMCLSIYTFTITRKVSIKSINFFTL